MIDETICLLTITLYMFKFEYFMVHIAKCLKFMRLGRITYAIYFTPLSLGDRVGAATE